ncbi:MAG: carboxypeptidase regulatory-like domain-containing protein [Planctomycetaceae bacterium]|nr:carboxypeptidase regulatory-like domain-containing protein [Planctomycetaceae bacterium]
MRAWGLAKTALIAATLLPAFVGCGDSSAPTLVPAGGIITYQSRPLAGAKVTFVPKEKGSVAMATSDAAGKFKLKTGTESGAAVGTCLVSVTMMETSEESGLSKSMSPNDMQKMQMEGKLEPLLTAREKSLIPKRYAVADTSGISFEVKKNDENQFTIDLKD